MLTGLDTMPVSINLWRCFMHWVGGMGVIVLMVAVLPLLGIGGRQIFRAETPGPMKESSLTPRIAETAKGPVGRLCSAHRRLHPRALAGRHGAVGCSDPCLLDHGAGRLLHPGRQPGAFDSVPIETVTIVFALLSGINYATHYLALVRRTPRPTARTPSYAGSSACSGSPWSF